MGYAASGNYDYIKTIQGDDELSSGKATLKDMRGGETKKVSIGEDFVDDYLTFSTAQDDLSF